MIPYFRDKRYIRVNNKPLLLIYRTTFVNLSEALQALRQEAKDIAGIELHLVCAEGYGSGGNEIKAGFDAIYEYPNGYEKTSQVKSKASKFKFYKEFNGLIRDYAELSEFYKFLPKPNYKKYKGVTLGWDNTARKNSSANILENFTLEKYHDWLTHCVNKTTQTFSGDEQIVFINAWNEWAEGTYLEPDNLYGLKYLEATKSALEGAAYMSGEANELKKINVSNVKNTKTKAIMNYKPYLWRELNIDKSTGYSSKVRTELFKAIKDPGELMLDVGCGEGATSAELRKQFPKSKFYGIELNADAALVASTQLDQIITCNFEEIDYKKHKLSEGMFSTILFADVLEHMHNPWKALESAKKILHKNGKVVASIPNIFNIHLLDNLANGRWNYEEYGILDFTHIRFFTLESIMRMFEETGYTISNIYGLPIPESISPPVHFDNDGSVHTESLTLKSITKEHSRLLNILQFVVTAHPKS
jgi:2-polyprenyl-3-methyl-5-hydroxy-6-metoxy-1,4-benzoquinol methylase